LVLVFVALAAMPEVGDLEWLSSEVRVPHTDEAGGTGERWGGLRGWRVQGGVAVLEHCITGWFLQTVARMGGHGHLGDCQRVLLVWHGAVKLGLRQCLARLRIATRAARRAPSPLPQRPKLARAHTLSLAVAIIRRRGAWAGCTAVLLWCCRGRGAVVSERCVGCGGL
jgi:uncharacterized membrane protein